MTASTHRFDGPARAIACATAIAEAVRPLGIEVRGGLHTGECEISDGKCTGLSVSIGARVMAHASPGEVLVSQTVKDLVAGSGLTFEDAGEHELKGVPDRWRLYRVVHESTQIQDVRYVMVPDGTYIAYLTVGEGPVDIVWQPEDRTATSTSSGSTRSMWRGSEASRVSLG